MYQKIFTVFFDRKNTQTNISGKLISSNVTEIQNIQKKIDVKNRDFWNFGFKNPLCSLSEKMSIFLINH